MKEAIILINFIWGKLFNKNEENGKEYNWNKETLIYKLKKQIQGINSNELYFYLMVIKIDQYHEPVSFVWRQMRPALRAVLLDPHPLNEAAAVVAVLARSFHHSKSYFNFNRCWARRRWAVQRREANRAICCFPAFF
jgi:hypothetical protein